MVSSCLLPQFGAAATTDRGGAGRWSRFDPTVGSNWGNYQVVLADSPGYDVEELRPVVAEIVAELDLATASRHTLVPGTRSDWTPGPGEIVVRISTDCPPSPRERVLGCGGPFSRVGDQWTSGRVTLTPEGVGPDGLRALLAHEMGHALGLGHPPPDPGGHPQLMDDGVTGLDRFQAGDLSGLRALSGR